MHVIINWLLIVYLGAFKSINVYITRIFLKSKIIQGSWKLLHFNWLYKRRISEFYCFLFTQNFRLDKPISDYFFIWKLVLPVLFNFNLLWFIFVKLFVIIHANIYWYSKGPLLCYQLFEYVDILSINILQLIYTLVIHFKYLVPLLYSSYIILVIYLKIV